MQEDHIPYNAAMAIAIIGGGAAGMMAAATIIEKNPHADVWIIEKNDILGKKVLISGGGRCNVTTGLTDIKKLLTKYPRGARFLQHALYEFSPEKVYAWFEHKGVALKTEKDLRVFPLSDNGKEVVGIFEKILRALPHAEIWTGHTVQKIIKKNDKFEITIKGKSQPITAEKIILTTGGQAYRQTGSTGDGYTFAEQLGHTITPLAPSLSSFMTQEQWPKKIAGVAITHAVLTAHTDKKQKTEGPFLFTHWGISGPAVFALSAITAFERYTKERPMRITIDFIPEKNGNILATELEKIRTAHPQKSIANTLASMVPRSLAEKICETQKMLPTKKNQEISNAEKQKMLEGLKHMGLHVIGRGAGDEFVTAGGINLQEVERTTMASKKCPGLFFAGEILDIDGFTGGFNLQAAWATGRLAGENAAKN